MDYTDQDYLVILGRNIAAKRKELQFTQSDLAGFVNMEVPNLSVIETGKSNPQLLTLVRICAALGCNLSDLLPRLSQPEEFLQKPAVYSPRRHQPPRNVKPIQSAPKSTDSKRKPKL